jgi:hypothetical protein
MRRAGELRNLRKYDELNLRALAGDALFIGPTMSVRFSRPSCLLPDCLRLQPPILRTTIGLLVRPRSNDRESVE